MSFGYLGLTDLEGGSEKGADGIMRINWGGRRVALRQAKAAAGGRQGSKERRDRENRVVWMGRE